MQAACLDGGIIRSDRQVRGRGPFGKPSIQHTPFKGGCRSTKEQAQAQQTHQPAAQSSQLKSVGTQLSYSNL